MKLFHVVAALACLVTTTACGISADELSDARTAFIADARVDPTDSTTAHADGTIAPPIDATTVVPADASATADSATPAFDATQTLIDASIVITQADAAPSSPDAAHSAADAHVASPDAAHVTADAHVASPDAAHSTADAHIASPDAAHTAADAAVTTVDASVPTVDAATIRPDGAIDLGLSIQFDLTPTDPSSNPSPTFRFSASKPSTFRCTIAGVFDVSTCTSPFVVPVTLTAGSYDLQVTATEADGATTRGDFSWTVNPPSCGDGFVNPGEVCDDGNNDDGDACSSDCQVFFFAGGDGSVTHPYEIQNAQQLIAANNSNLLSNSFVVTADIDLTGVAMQPIGFVNDSSSFTFEGTFDGAGHRISNWRYSATSYCVGFFGDFDGLVHDLVLVDPNVTGNGAVGALVGCNDGGRIIRNAVRGGQVSATDTAGGLVGTQDSNDGNGLPAGIASCSSSASVSSIYAGGIVGESDDLSEIIDSYATGAVNGTRYAGGLIAFENTDYIAVARVYATGAVPNLDNAQSGGLAPCTKGSNVDPCDDSTTDAYWDIDLSGMATSGGAELGLTSDQMADPTKFTNWDFTNTWVANTDSAPTLRPGGNTAPLTIQQSISAAQPIPNPFTITAFDLENDDLTFEIVTPPARGVVTPLGGNQFTYTPDSWSAYSTTMTYRAIDSHGAASIETPLSFYVSSQCNPAEPGFADGGDGSDNNPYVITTLAELQLVHEYVACNYVLANDIDLGGIAFEPIGSMQQVFKATFDGGGHTISNWTYAGTDSQVPVAFISGLEYGAVRNLAMSNENLSSTSYAGGIVGYVDTGTITNCSSSGSISGSNEAGGIVGNGSFVNVTSSSSSATIRGSEAGGIIGFHIFGTVTGSNFTGTIPSGYYVGGIVGFSLYASIVSSFSTGNVVGDGFAGGLAGYWGPDGNVIRDSYATGAVTGSPAGGLIGESENEPGSITRTFALGKVTSGGLSGGLVGQEEVTGVVTFTDVFWDTDTTGKTTTANNDGTAESDAAMKTQATYVGFDFSNVWIMSSSGYPTLR